jgi:hypothetical protein
LYSVVVQILLYLFVSADASQRKPEIPLEDGRTMVAGQAHDAEEFELEGLISDDDIESVDEHQQP